MGIDINYQPDMFQVGQLAYNSASQQAANKMQLYRDQNSQRTQERNLQRAYELQDRDAQQQADWLNDSIQVAEKTANDLRSVYNPNNLTEPGRATWAELQGKLKAVQKQRAFLTPQAYADLMGRWIGDVEMSGMDNHVIKVPTVEEDFGSNAIDANTGLPVDWAKPPKQMFIRRKDAKGNVNFDFHDLTPKTTGSGVKTDPVKDEAHVIKVPTVEEDFGSNAIDANTGLPVDWAKPPKQMFIRRKDAKGNVVFDFHDLAPKTTGSGVKTDPVKDEAQAIKVLEGRIEKDLELQMAKDEQTYNAQKAANDKFIKEEGQPGYWNGPLPHPDLPSAFNRQDPKYTPRAPSQDEIDAELARLNKLRGSSQPGQQPGQAQAPGVAPAPQPEQQPVSGGIEAQGMAGGVPGAIQPPQPNQPAAPPLPFPTAEQPVSGGIEAQDMSGVVQGATPTTEAPAQPVNAPPPEVKSALPFPTVDEQPGPQMPITLPQPKSHEDAVARERVSSWLEVEQAYPHILPGAVGVASKVAGLFSKYGYDINSWPPEIREAAEANYGPQLDAVENFAEYLRTDKAEDLPDDPSEWEPGKVYFAHDPSADGKLADMIFDGQRLTPLQGFAVDKAK